MRLRALHDSPGAFGSTAEGEAALPGAHWVELVARSLEGDHLVICVADAEAGFAGMSAARWHDRERGIAHLWGMWVDPAARRGGLGESLVDAVAAWAAGHDARFVRLGVVDRPGDATGFYQRIGFVLTGEVQPLRRDPAHAVHYLARPV